MMPKVLNVEQLENKFSCLTRARESITGLSTWIMRHSEFCDGIVEEWLACLSKNFNAMTMFYLANDVIMQCGKKRVPQYRVAFAKALENAVGLPNVKEISYEVCRIINIWRNRDLFEEGFCQRLIDKLQGKEKETEVPAVTEESELDIIANYKKENLIDKVIKLKHINDEMNEKEEILKCADEPSKSDFVHLGSQEGQNMLQKITRYCNTVKGFIKLVNDEIEMREKLLKELNRTNIFYTSQYEDVKKVAHAYKIYGKKIKKVAKQLSDKRETLSPAIATTYFSDNDISSPKSPDDAFSPSEDFSYMSASPSSTLSDSVKEPSHQYPISDSHDVSKTSPFKKSSRNINQKSKIFQIFTEGQEPKSEVVSETYNTTPEKSESIKVSPGNCHQQSDSKKVAQEEIENYASEILSAGADSSTPTASTGKNNLEDVDQWLENSFKRGNMKRKIELLLKTKNKKSCPDPNQQDVSKDAGEDLGIKPDAIKSAKKEINTDINDQTLKKKIQGKPLRLCHSVENNQPVEESRASDPATEISLFDQGINALANSGNAEKLVVAKSSRSESLLDQRINALTRSSDTVQQREAESNRGMSLLDQRIHAMTTKNSNTLQLGGTESNRGINLLDQKIDDVANSSYVVPHTGSESNRGISLLDQRIDAMTRSSDTMQHRDSDSDRGMSLLDQRINAMTRSSDTMQQGDSDYDRGKSLLDQRINAMTRNSDTMQHKDSDSDKGMSLLDQRINAMTKSSDTMQHEDSDSDRGMSLLDQRINAMTRSSNTVQQGDSASNRGVSLLDQRINAMTRSSDTMQQGDSESNRGISLLDQRINAMTKSSDTMQHEDSDSDRGMSLLDQRINALMARNSDLEQKKNIESNEEESLLDQRMNALTTKNNDSEQSSNITSVDSSKTSSSLDQRIDCLVKNININLLGTKNIASLVNQNKKEVAELKDINSMEVDDDMDKKQVVKNLSVNKSLDSSLNDVSAELLKNGQTNDESAEKVQLSVESDTEDTFFSSLCNSTSSDNKNLIPGLEMHEEFEIKKESVNQNEDEKMQSLENPKNADKEILEVNNLKIEEEVTVKIEMPESMLSTENICNNLQDAVLSSQNKSFEDLKQKSDSTSAAGSSVETIAVVQDVCDSSVNINCKDQKIATSTVSGLQNRTDKKPKNMLETVCCILECLSKNKTNSNLGKPCESYKNELKSDLSFENCLKIYRVLQNKNLTSSLNSNNDNRSYKDSSNINSYSTVLGTQNGASDFCMTTNALHGPILSTFDSSNVSNSDSSINIKDISLDSSNVKDNFEVADMDCDSE
ncbi:putative leucine-rich repeat-containing protein DDB_G0290503 isoform X1 [Parasteatoda tepidariorum]|uniref:putative leucine-rich repeat-containing protein DDB_G0290503 isoform X1 n=2 Tax=Parasteatoda tepidariorum TaxID=114398 RepID=UPI001C721DB6|nr:dentin sialophosphoprotein isoform X1 [Parasteatoda tepidariorum]XP_015904340.2 dentin sialophosphoprotein isoform X1 [Parasteatoda tepidariorum]XP_042900027.1 dentin sialophosphoprotein isoform X1 [Parasteatoda tepidariorum]XP_042900028.1 dentin sialophosphoprotein isoform X1 [Parasteatoda tepidariorum]XP_042900029.1 dentin sialophosphoprotein isoform X1 [Parasteatoda tepidariorum]XP_042900030.1 dentin sialophosphoprotein isoform X1 [Parasteatoda tepidariorum]